MCALFSTIGHRSFATAWQQPNSKYANDGKSNEPNRNSYDTTISSFANSATTSSTAPTTTATRIWIAWSGSKLILLDA
jgi:hypothetical protein